MNSQRRFQNLLLATLSALLVALTVGTPPSFAEPEEASANAAVTEKSDGSQQRNCQGELGAPCCQGCQDRARLVKEGKASPRSGGCPCQQRAKAAAEAAENASP